MLQDIVFGMIGEHGINRLIFKESITIAGGDSYISNFYYQNNMLLGRNAINQTEYLIFK